MEYQYVTQSISGKDVEDHNAGKLEPVNMDTYVEHELAAWSAHGYEYAAGPAVYVNNDGHPVYVFTLKKEIENHSVRLKSKDMIGKGRKSETRSPRWSNSEQ